MRFSNLPLCSSQQVIRALERLGCYRARTGRGSHSSYLRNRGDRILTAIVVQGSREIPKGTLRNILTRLEIPLEDFLANL